MIDRKWREDIDKSSYWYPIIKRNKLKNVVAYIAIH